MQRSKIVEQKSHERNGDHTGVRRKKGGEGLLARETVKEANKEYGRKARPALKRRKTCNVKKKGAQRKKTVGLDTLNERVGREKRKRQPSADGILKSAMPMQR